MNICHLVPFRIPARSGAFSRFYSVAKPLALELGKYFVLSLSPTGKPHSSPRNWNSFSIYELPGSVSWDARRPARTLRALYRGLLTLDRVVKRNRIDVVICHNPFLPLTAPSIVERLLRNTKLVVDYLDILSMDFEDRAFDQILEGLVLHRADLVLGISRYLCDRAAHSGANSVAFVPPMVDTSKFVPRREPLHLSKAKSTTVIFTGYWWRIKGVGLLVDAVSLLRRELEGVVFQLVGGTVEDVYYFNSIVPEPLRRYFHLVGQVPATSMPSFYSNADIAVIPFPENIVNVAAGPTKLVEYMAAGLPVVGSCVGDIPFILGNGECGVIVDPNPESLAEGLIHLISNHELRASLGVRARERAVECHDMYRQSARTYELLTQLIS